MCTFLKNRIKNRIEWSQISAQILDWKKDAHKDKHTEKAPKIARSIYCLNESQREEENLRRTLVLDYNKKENAKVLSLNLV